MVTTVSFVWLLTRFGFAVTTLIGANVYDVLQAQRLRQHKPGLKSVDSPVPARHQAEPYTILSLVQQMESLWRRRTVKLRVLLGIRSVDRQHRYRSYKQALGQYNRRLAAGQKLVTHKSNSAWTLLVYLYGLVILAEPVLLTYFVYLAAVQQLPQLFVISLLAMAAVMTLTIWTDEYTSDIKKLQLSLFIPLLTVAYYLIGFIRTGILIGNLLRSISRLGKSSLSGRPLHKARRAAKRAVVIFTGFPLLILGIILIPLPGPGLLISFMGLLILSLEFDWATVSLNKTKAQFKKIYLTAKTRADKIEQLGNQPKK